MPGSCRTSCMLHVGKTAHPPASAPDLQTIAWPKRFWLLLTTSCVPSMLWVGCNAVQLPREASGSRQIFRSFISAKNGKTGLSSFPESIRDFGRGGGGKSVKINLEKDLNQSSLILCSPPVIYICSPWQKWVALLWRPRKPRALLGSSTLKCRLQCPTNPWRQIPDRPRSLGRLHGDITHLHSRRDLGAGSKIWGCRQDK